MSWSPDLFIGELRPWPDSVHVVRGNTDEARRYFPERKDGQETLERRIDELCAEVERLQQIADGAANEADRLTHDAAALQIENAKLRELARGLGQCSQCVDCEDCLLYDLSEPDHCREERLSRELGIEVPDGEV